MIMIRNNFVRIFILTIILNFAIAGSAFAGRYQHTIIIHNNTGATIIRYYIADNNSTNWGAIDTTKNFEYTAVE